MKSSEINRVIPAQAGIQQEKNAFSLNPLDSRLRGNDGANVINYGNINRKNLTPVPFTFN
ncbi:MAG: hypothetical protein IPM27_01085 [Nitrosomonadales bacterium]|nr:hypothetical protein [Nitrosomonadales bacterium]